MPQGFLLIIDWQVYRYMGTFRDLDEVQTEAEGPTGRKAAESRHTRWCIRGYPTHRSHFQSPRAGSRKEMREQQCRAGAGDGGTVSCVLLPPSAFISSLPKEKSNCVA